MLDTDQLKLIYDDIPTSFDVPDTGSTDRTLNATKIYINQFDFDAFPSILLSYDISTSPNFEPLNNKTIPGGDDNYIQTTTGESHGYSVAVTDYALNNGEIESITELKGTVGGTPDYVFIENTDYEVVGTNTIRWLGATTPDDSTDFFTTYNHYMKQIKKGIEYKDTLTVDVVAEDVKGSGYYRPGPRVVQEIVRQLHDFFVFDFDIQDIVIVDYSEVRNLDDLVESEYHYRRQFTVTFRYKVTSDVITPRIADVTEPTIIFGT